MNNPPDKQETLTALVVDDDAVIRIAIEDCLDESGFSIVEASDGAMALERFESQPMDLVLLDVGLPKLDGFSVCASIRSKPAGEHLPILMMTGTDDSVSVSQAFEAGATDFITKPINLDLLLHRIRYMLRATQTSALLRRRESSLANAQRIARLGNWERDLSNDQLSCSTMLLELLGIDNPKPVWQDFLERVCAQDRGRVVDELTRLDERGGQCELDFRIDRVDGAKLFVHQESQVIVDDSNGCHRMIGTVQDVTSIHEAQTRIRELAYNDSVTGLANRVMLYERLHAALETAQRHQRILGLLFVDLDRFKRINDTWGHSVGDDLLRLVAERVTNSVRGYDFAARLSSTDAPFTGRTSTVARLAGDEFVVVLPELNQPEEAAIVAHRINEQLKSPFRVNSTDVYVSSSIGISIFPHDAHDVEELLRTADAAMYEAKAAGRNDYRFYTAKTQKRAVARLGIEAGLRRALEQDEFRLHFQPKIDLSTDAVTGTEALIRWQDPTVGLLGPGEFISIAEDCGLIVPMGRWVLEHACAQAQWWHRRGLQDLSVSVNLSVVQMRDRELLNTIRQALDSSGLPPDMLELELTEGLLMQDTVANIKLLHQLKALGLKLSIDDFGTGYSSLQYLKNLPIDALKIDRCFIQDVEHDKDDAAIVSGTVGLAHSLRLRVIAEGVETERQREIVRTLGCDSAQGYYFSPPISASKLEHWVVKYRQENGDIHTNKSSGTDQISIPGEGLRKSSRSASN